MRRLRKFIYTVRRREEEVEFYKNVALESQRQYLHLATAFRFALDQPEIDIREDLDLLIEDLGNQMAVIQEHVL